MSSNEAPDRHVLPRQTVESVATAHGILVRYRDKNGVTQSARFTDLKLANRQFRYWLHLLYRDTNLARELPPPPEPNPLHEAMQRSLNALPQPSPTAPEKTLPPEKEKP